MVNITSFLCHHDLSLLIIFLDWDVCVVGKKPTRREMIMNKLQAITEMLSCSLISSLIGFLKRVKVKSKFDIL